MATPIRSASGSDPPGRPFYVGAVIEYRGLRGTVVANLDTGEWQEGFAPRRLRDLRRGIVVRWDDQTLSHFREPAISLAPNVTR